MQPAKLKCCLRAAQISVAMATVITALLGFAPQSSDDGGAEAGHRAGLTGDVRIVTDARLAWVTCSEGRRA